MVEAVVNVAVWVASCFGFLAFEFAVFAFGYARGLDDAKKKGK